MRLWLATVLAWLSGRVAPRPMQSVFIAYCDMLKDFPEQLRMGRTYGVASTIWTLDRSDRDLAERIRSAGTAAMTRERMAILEEEE